MIYDMICFQTGELDSFSIHDFEYDRENLVYGKAHKDIPNYVDKALERQVPLSHYVDTNLFHDIKLL